MVCILARSTGHDLCRRLPCACLHICIYLFMYIHRVHSPISYVCPTLIGRKTRSLTARMRYNSRKFQHGESTGSKLQGPAGRAASAFHWHLEPRQQTQHTTATRCGLDQQQKVHSGLLHYLLLVGPMFSDAFQCRTSQADLPNPS